MRTRTDVELRRITNVRTVGAGGKLLSEERQSAMPVQAPVSDKELAMRQNSAAGTGRAGETGATAKPMPCDLSSRTMIERPHAEDEFMRS